MRSFIKASVLMFAVAPLMATVVAKAEPIGSSTNCPLPIGAALGEDPIFTFQFFDNANPHTLYGSGTLNATPIAPGTYRVDSGSITVTSQWGTYSMVLLPNPDSNNGRATSPSNCFWYDNIIYPDNQFGWKMDTNGLLFVPKSGSGPLGWNNPEINIWGNGNIVQYSYYEGVGQGSYHGYDNVTFNTNSNPHSLSAVPIPSVAFLSPVLLAGFAALGRFRKQRA